MQYTTVRIVETQPRSNAIGAGDVDPRTMFESKTPKAKIGRRPLLQAALGAAAAPVLSSCTPSDSGPNSGEASATLAGYSLEELRELYRYDLFDDFLAFVEKHVVDPEYGGFMCNTDRAGKNITTQKATWYEGRGIWVYSYLFNNLAKEDRYLDIARKSVEFIVPRLPEDGGLWPGAFSREGVPLNSRASDIYGGLFVANGLAEYAKASGEDKYRTLAKEIIVSHLAMYDSPDYSYPVSYGPNLPIIPAPRVLGHWMVLLRLSTQMLETAPAPDLERIADRSIEALLDYHYNPEFGLLNEVIHHDLSRPTNGLEQFCYIGHAIETLWMVMFEAKRRNDPQLYKRAAEMFRRHVEIAWDDVHGGFFRSIDHVENNTWQTDKVLWLQEEVLVGTLFMIEHDGDEWARRWFDKTYRYVREKYPLEPHGYSLWILSADRKVTFVEKATRVGNFHHPRHLMINLLSLDRLIANGGSPTSA